MPEIPKAFFTILGLTYTRSQNWGQMDQWHITIQSILDKRRTASGLGTSHEEAMLEAARNLIEVERGL